MKKTKIYIIAPIVFLAIFGAYYWNFSSKYEAQQALVVQAAKEKKLATLKAEAEAREAAIHDALEAQKQRKADRAARDEKERKQKDDRENARLEAEKADQEAQKLQRQAEKLTKDVATAKEEIAKIESEEKRSNEELVFLKQYISEANANKGRLADVISKIEAADLAVAKAAAAAAAAAAKKNN
jgi:flagellar motility protein MotE (MotC chaperone)